MSKSPRTLLVLLALLATAPASAAQQAKDESKTAVATQSAPRTAKPGTLGLGRVATDDEIAAWDIDVRPDGFGLPKGKGTAAHGEELFAQQCAHCHGDFGEAIGRWPPLAGGAGTLTAERPLKTIGSYWPYLSTVYDYVRRAMPFGNARSLSDDDVYALTAYLLQLNDVIQDPDFELSNENFSSIHLPNEANFIDDDRLSEPNYAKKIVPCMANCKPSKAEVSAHAAVLDVTPEKKDDAAGEKKDEEPAKGGIE